MRLTANWRLVVVATVAGLASGTIGAVVFGRVAKSPAPQTTPVATPGPPQAVVPPGWNLALLSRLAQVEQKVDNLQAPAGAPPAPAEAPADPGQSPDEKARLEEREQERTAHYQKELDYLEKALADHASEPSDDAWARPLAANMEQSINKVLEGSGKTKLVDCSSKTCTATLAFPTPGDALVG